MEERALRELVEVIDSQRADGNIPSNAVLLTPEMVSAIHEARMVIRRRDRERDG